MKALTVQQPWAWAIVHGGKDVENRVWSTDVRDTFLVHAGGRFDSDGGLDRNLLRHPDYADAPLDRGALIGSADLVGVHAAREDCCGSSWGQPSWPGEKPNFHWELADQRALERPIPCRGRLGLWTPGNDLLDQVTDQLGVRW